MSVADQATTARESSARALILKLELDQLEL